MKSSSLGLGLGFAGGGERGAGAYYSEIWRFIV